jgi:hypothetical protein
LVVQYVTTLSTAKSSEKIEVYQGLKQECPLSPMLFGFHLDKMIMEWQKSMTNNFKINYILLDTVIFTGGEDITTDNSRYTSTGSSFIGRRN